jgi:hypothetical protein
LHILIDHTIIADTAFIQICAAVIIRYVVPLRFGILRFYHPHIKASIIRSRGKILLSFSMLYHSHYTGK